MNEKSNVFVKAKLFQCSVSNGAIHMPDDCSSYCKLKKKYKNSKQKETNTKATTII